MRGRWSLSQVQGPGVISRVGERPEEEKVKSMVDVLALEGHILVPMLKVVEADFVIIGNEVKQNISATVA